METIHWMFFRNKSRVTPFLNKTSINYLVTELLFKKNKENEMENMLMVLAFCEFNTVILILCDNIRISDLFFFYRKE